MKKYTLFFSLLVLLVNLNACGRAEHAYNKFKKQAVSEDPLKISVRFLESEQGKIEARTLLTDLYLPWSIVFLPDDTLLITEKPGGLYQYSLDTGEKKSIKGAPFTKVWGQGGLMDVIPHPNFEDNHWLYLSYAAPVERKLASTRVARARLINGELKDLEVLFTAIPAVNSGDHFGSALVFDEQGYLYITSGERGQRHLVQDLSTHLGKIVRLHDDGRVPADNPFVGVDGALPEIYSYGHRNPQGIVITPVGREVWAIEHGPRGGDEINRIQQGRNYGWPVISYGVEYDTQEPIGEGAVKEGMEQPLYYYVPSIATSGMSFYTKNLFSRWQDNLFIGALSGRHLNRLEIQDGRVVHEEKLLLELKLRIRDVEQGPDGFIYVLADSGVLIQLRPVAAL
jgi:glucose/arabinose dehydrogenase